MRLQLSLSRSWTLSQTDFCLSCTTAVLYIDKDLVTANIKIDTFFFYRSNRVG